MSSKHLKYVDYRVKRPIRTLQTSDIYPNQYFRYKRPNRTLETNDVKSKMKKRDAICWYEENCRRPYCGYRHSDRRTPIIKKCNYGVDCLRANCWFDHPNGTWKERTHRQNTKMASKVIEMEKKMVIMGTLQKQMKESTKEMKESMKKTEKKVQEMEEKVRIQEKHENRFRNNIKELEGKIKKQENNER